MYATLRDLSGPVTRRGPRAAGTDASCGNTGTGCAEPLSLPPPTSLLACFLRLARSGRVRGAWPMTGRHRAGNGADGVRMERVADAMKKHREPLLWIAIGVLGRHGDRDTAEGVVHDAWVHLAGGNSELPDDDEALVKTIRAVVRRTARNRRRYEARREGEPLEGVEAEVGTPCHEACILAAAEVRWGLDKLTPSEREVVTLRELEGASLEDIARRRGSKKRTVKEQLRRGRRRLRRALREPSGPP